MKPRKLQLYTEQKLKNTKRTFPTTKQVPSRAVIWKSKNISARQRRQDIGIHCPWQSTGLCRGWCWFSPTGWAPVHTIFQMLPYRNYTVLLKRTSMSVTVISFTTDIWTGDVRPMNTVGRQGFCNEESHIACSRMCWFSYRCCHFNDIWEHVWNMNTLLAPFEQLTREIS
jgi:hypothetical protein